MTISASKIEPLATFLGQFVFSVPEYQRGYEWTIDNIDQFHQTVLNCVNVKESRFLGTVILMKSGKGEAGGDQPVQLVDGQQRLTTIYIYLSVLRDKFHELKDAPLPKKGKVRVQVDPKSRCEDLLYDSSKEGLRIHANMLVRELFEECVIADPTPDEKGNPRPTLPKRHKAYTKNFRAATRRINELLEKAVAKDLSDSDRKESYLEIFEALSRRLNVLAITTDDQVEAMQIFTTMNTTGLGLSPSDIVKGQIFLEIISATAEESRTDTLEALQKEWQVILENLGSNIDSAFRHYFLGRTGVKFQLPELEKRVEEVLGKSAKRSDNARELLGELNEMSVVYSEILNPDVSVKDPTELFKAEVLQCMNQINVSARVLLLALLYPTNSAPVVSPKDMKRILQYTEAVVYRWILAGANAQELEDKFTNIAFAFSSGKPADQICEMLAGQLQPQEASEATLLRPMVDTRQVKSILYRIHQYFGDKPRFLKFDGDVLEVEHIAPKTATEEWEKSLGRKSSAEGADDLDSYEFQAEMIGNKTLLEQHINAAIKQRSFKEKSEGTKVLVRSREYSYSGYQASKVDMTSQLSKVNDEWSVAFIALRSSWLTDSFAKIFAIPQRLDELVQYESFIAGKSPKL